MSNHTQSLAGPFYWGGGLNFCPENKLDSLAGHLWTVGPAFVEGLSRFHRLPAGILRQCFRTRRWALSGSPES
jgi:hypothetical protein